MRVRRSLGVPLSRQHRVAPRREHGVAGAGDVDDCGLGGRELDRPRTAGRVQDRPRRPSPLPHEVDAAREQRGDPAEGLQLPVARRHGQQVAHLRRESRRLGHADGVHHHRHAVGGREVPGGGEGRDREVPVEHEHPGTGHHRLGGAHVLGREGVGRRHVGDPRHELAVVVEQRGVGAGRTEAAPHVGHVHAGRRRRVEHEPPQVVVADDAHQGHRATQVGEVLGHVASDAAGGERGGARVGGARHERGGGAGLEVGVDAADDHHAGVGSAWAPGHRPVAHGRHADPARGPCPVQDQR